MGLESMIAEMTGNNTALAIVAFLISLCFKKKESKIIAAGCAIFIMYIMQYGGSSASVLANRGWHTSDILVCEVISWLIIIGGIFGAKAIIKIIKISAEYVKSLKERHDDSRKNYKKYIIICDNKGKMPLNFKQWKLAYGSKLGNIKTNNMVVDRAKNKDDINYKKILTVFSTLVIISLFIFLFNNRNISNNIKLQREKIEQKNIGRTPGVINYKVKLPDEKTLDITSQKNNIHVSRPENFNAIDIFLDKCKLTPREQKILYENMDFQKAFMLNSTIEFAYASYRVLFEKCPGLDLLRITDVNKVLLDKELSNSKVVLIEHIGKAKYDCYHQHVIQYFNDAVVPAVVEVMLAQLQQQANGKKVTCALLKDEVFQKNMYAETLDIIRRIKQVNVQSLWNQMYKSDLPEQNDFDVRFSGNGGYVQ